MSEEDPNLSACMQKLKIMPRQKPAKTYRDEQPPIKINPFARKYKTPKNQSTLSLFGPSCTCKKKRLIKNTAFKRSTKMNVTLKSKIIREPISIYIDTCKHVSSKRINCKMLKPIEPVSANSASAKSSKKTKLFGENVIHQDFKTIIAGCEQLSLSGNSSESPCFSSQNFRDSRTTQTRSERSASNVNSSSCSQQAMARLCINPPCDVTIDELASYFETFVHIPKKMSSMAEMMYI